MANKQDFTPEEWDKILQSPMLVGIAVSMADPSGLWGALKEAAAGSAEIGTARRDASANALINAVITDINTADRRPPCKTPSGIALPVRNRLSASSARSPICVRPLRFSMQKHLWTRRPSKLGCAPSVRKWRRLRPRVRSSASGCASQRCREGHARRHLQSAAHEKRVRIFNGRHQVKPIK